MVESKQKLDVIKFVLVKDGKAGNILGWGTAERRNTPHVSTGKSPALLLMNRELRTKIPSVENLNRTTQADWACQHDKMYKHK